MKSSSKILIFILLATLCSCNSNFRKLNALLNRMDKDEQVFQSIKEVDFPVLVADFRFCDSMFMVLRVDNEQQRQALHLLGAYLQQFETEYPKMIDEIAYSRIEIANLKDDISNDLLNEDQINDAMYAETDIANRIHNVADYFNDRFGKQHVAVEQMKQYIDSINR